MEAAMTSTFRKGQDLAVPAAAVEAAGIKDGDLVVFEQTEGGLLVHAVDAKSAERAIADGEGRVFGSDDEFDSYLRSFPEPDGE